MGKDVERKQWSCKIGENGWRSSLLDRFVDAEIITTPSFDADGLPLFSACVNLHYNSTLGITTTMGCKFVFVEAIEN